MLFSHASGIAIGMAAVNADWNIVVSIRWIAMKFGTDIHRKNKVLTRVIPRLFLSIPALLNIQGMSCEIFGYPLTFIDLFMTKYLQN